jgi:hypothetical protein
LTVGYIGLLVMAWIVFLVIALAVTILAFPQTWARMLSLPAYVLLLYVAGCLVIIPLDRFIDERYRRLEKLKVEPPTT